MRSLCRRNRKPTERSINPVSRSRDRAFIYRDYWSNNFGYGKNKPCLREHRSLDWSLEKSSQTLQSYILYFLFYSILFFSYAVLNLLLMTRGHIIFHGLTMLLNTLGGYIFCIITFAFFLSLLLKMIRSKSASPTHELQLSFDADCVCIVRHGEEMIARNLADPNKLLQKYKPIELENIGSTPVFFTYLESLPATLRRKHTIRYLAPFILFVTSVLAVLWHMPWLRFNTNYAVWEVVLSSSVYLQVIGISIWIYKSGLESSITRISLNIRRFKELYSLPLSIILGISWIMFVVLIYQLFFSIFSFLFSRPLIFTAETGFLSPEVLNWLIDVSPLLINASTVLLVIMSVNFPLHLFEAKHAFNRLNLFLYDNRIDSKIHPYAKQEDRPSWLTEDFYWVMRFTYFWGYELTFPLPHVDWERVECWCNAETGILEWVVFDYHYRELWCKVDANLEPLYVFFDGNFHTPLPVVSKKHQSLLKDRLQITRPSFLLRGKENLNIQVSNWLRQIQSAHTERMISQYLENNIMLKTCARLPWTSWRYCKGANRDEIYGTGKEGASLHQPEGTSFE